MTNIALSRRDERTHKSKKVHTCHEFADLKVDFNKQVTLSPNLIHEAWSNLNMNTQFIEYHLFPQLMHSSFVRALCKSKRLNPKID